jgi:hypothetical protein
VNGVIFLCRVGAGELQDDFRTARVAGQEIGDLILAIVSIRPAYKERDGRKERTHIVDLAV